MKKFNHSFAIITIFSVFIVSALFVTAVIRHAKADPLPVKLSPDQFKRMAQIQIEEIAEKQRHEQIMSDITQRYLAIREETHAPKEFVNDIDGNIIVGFKPKEASK